jgi:predicted  nucleic acid-binding Zn-ribbon protein
LPFFNERSLPVKKIGLPLYQQKKTTMDREAEIRKELDDLQLELRKIYSQISEKLIELKKIEKIKKGIDG